MRYRDAVRLAARHGACKVALRQLRKLRSWDEFFLHPSQGAWRAWWIVTGLPVPTRRGMWVAERQLTHREEPDVTHRLEIAIYIDQSHITRLLSTDEEPDSDVRDVIAWRIPAERLDRLLSPEEEPSSVVRAVVAERIPLERISGIPSADDEPDEDVRRIIVERLTHR